MLVSRGFGMRGTSPTNEGKTYYDTSSDQSLSCSTKAENSKSGSDDWLREIGDRILDYDHDVRSYRLWRLGDRMQEARLAILSSLPTSVTMYIYTCTLSLRITSYKVAGKKTTTNNLLYFKLHDVIVDVTVKY